MPTTESLEAPSPCISWIGPYRSNSIFSIESKIADEQVACSIGAGNSIYRFWKAKIRLYTAVYTDIHGQNTDVQVQKINTGARGAELGCIHRTYSPIYTKTCLNTTHIQ